VIDPNLVETFVTVWNKRNNSSIGVSSINCGWCYQFAVVIVAIYGGEFMTPGWYHAWVKVDGLNYDSANLKGTTDENMQAGKVVSYEKLKEIWDERGSSGPIQEDTLLEVIETYLKVA